MAFLQGYFISLKKCLVIVFSVLYLNCQREPGMRKRKKKTKKDPDAPKRPQSAYFIWLNENREKIKEEQPGISITELSKVAGEKWREMTDKTVGGIYVSFMHRLK